MKAYFCFLLNKDINFNKIETESKMENPTILERQSLCFSSYKNRKLKLKLWWVGARKRKKKEFFCTVYFVRRKLFNHMCFISMYSVYWIHFQNRHTFIYQRTLLHTRFCLALKCQKPIFKIKSVSLRLHTFSEIDLRECPRVRF